MKSQTRSELLCGGVSGLAGVIVVYLVAWSLASDAVTKTSKALGDAYKPGVTELIYAVTMAESLAASDSPTAGETQSEVLSLAEAQKEREDFSAAVGQFELRGIRLLFENSELEKQILQMIQGHEDLPNQTNDEELAKLDRAVKASEKAYQELLLISA